MVDGGIVAGYLTVLLTGAARRFVDNRIDGGLKRLYDQVVRRLGGRAVHELRSAPEDAHAQDRLARAVERHAAVDHRFADEIARIVAQLDRAGGRRIVNQVQARTNMQNFGGDQAIQGGVINKTWSRSTEHPANYSGAPTWVKALTALGAVLALGGMALLVVDVITAISSGQDEFGRPQFPDLGDLRRGAILFACGLVLSLVGSLGRSMSRRGW